MGVVLTPDALSPSKILANVNEITKNSLESGLRQLKCHFTWNLIEGENSLDDFENRVFNQVELQNSEFKATTCNILAYIKHLRGQNEAALECLQQAEELIQREHADQAEIRSLVTWGNYAWVYYHMGRLSEAQMYLDKVKQVCKKFSSPYRIESPEIDCEEGWTWLKCGGNSKERAKVCFEKALDKKPKNPEFTSGLAIASYCLDTWPPDQNPIGPLRKAIGLNPENQYVKVLLALKLQEIHEESEGESLVEEALEKAAYAEDVVGAAKFFQKKEALDKAIEVLGKALECMPNKGYLHYHIGCCYRAKVLQIQRDGNGRKKMLQEVIEQAVDHLKKADDLGVNLPNVCSYLACLYAQTNRYEEADHYFQKEFRKELNPVAKQLLHLRYGNFQLYQMHCEEKAIDQFIEGVKINQSSKEKEKMKNKLQRIAEMRLSQNGADSEALRLLGILAELKEEVQQRDEDWEEGLDSASLLPSASIVKAGAEE
ncbi:interferon-induced protein with tetratricopeptide repeats 2 [Orycteropus afer afer]|uniref:Interferon-induced protein with tetratricopeptide repeats 2 n=1 Tax=Orycteropus afer afer TaxID=1230840 RepID=A0A8B7A4C4_ORYAF|nr:interferon-induced protein with tetratricopeptide repeats 2 [Orycteropus afer afer]